MLRIFLMFDSQFILRSSIFQNKPSVYPELKGRSNGNQVPKMLVNIEKKFSIKRATRNTSIKRMDQDNNGSFEFHFIFVFCYL